MTLHSPLPRAATFGLVAAILALGLALRAWNLGGESLWLDEAHSIVQGRRWWRTLWGPNAVHEPSPPLYFTVLHIWLRVFGESEAIARALSALFGMATILVVFVLGGIAGGTRVAVAAAALAATSPMLVIYSRETRGYALAILAAAICLCGALTVLSRLAPASKSAGWPLRRSAATTTLAWVAYVSGAIVAVYTHNTLVLLPVVASIAALILWTTAPHLDWTFATRWLLANAAILAAYLPWVPKVLGGDVAAGSFWVPSLSAGEAFAVTRSVYGQAYAAAIQPWFDIALAALAVVGVAALRRAPAATLFCAVLVLVPLLTYLVSLYRPIFIPRVLLWPLPILAVVIAAGALSVPSKAAAAAVGTLVVGQLIGVGDPRATTKQEPWREVAERIAAERRPGDAILLAPSYAGMPFEFYTGPDRDVLTIEMRGPVQRNPLWSYDVIAPTDLPARVADRQRVWLVTRVEPVDLGVDGLAPRVAGAFTLIESRVAKDLKLFLFARQP
ncbi:MAG TPA: glycosyltransferase family 39 protein [Alphaproteobacteria bacterium]|nr:glycosyltransferase family 39 protein [Alphaproteobacteria bacterium]